MSSELTESVGDVTEWHRRYLLFHDVRGRIGMYGNLSGFYWEIAGVATDYYRRGAAKDAEDAN